MSAMWCSVLVCCVVMTVSGGDYGDVICDVTVVLKSIQKKKYTSILIYAFAIML